MKTVTMSGLMSTFLLLSLDFTLYDHHLPNNALSCHSPNTYSSMHLHIDLHLLAKNTNNLNPILHFSNSFCISKILMGFWGFGVLGFRV